MSREIDLLKNFVQHFFTEAGIKEKKPSRLGSLFSFSAKTKTNEPELSLKQMACKAAAESGFFAFVRNEQLQRAVWQGNGMAFDEDISIVTEPEPIAASNFIETFVARFCEKAGIELTSDMKSAAIEASKQSRLNRILKNLDTFKLAEELSRQGTAVIFNGVYPPGRNRLEL